MIPRWTRNLIAKTVVSHRKIGSAVPIQSPIKWSARNGKSFQFLKTFSPPPPLGLLHGRIVAEHRGNIDRRVKWAQTVRPKPNVQRLQQRVLRRLRFFLKVDPFAREEELCSASYGVKNVEAIDDCDAQKRPGGDINNNSLSGREKKENKRFELLFVTNNIARRKPIENGENESKCKNRNKGGGGDNKAQIMVLWIFTMWKEIDRRHFLPSFVVLMPFQARLMQMHATSSPPFNHAPRPFHFLGEILSDVGTRMHARDTSPYPPR